MNKIYRLVRNRSTGAWVPASELTHLRGKPARGAVRGVVPGLIVALAGAAGACGYAAAAEVVIDGGAEESVPGTQSVSWHTGNGNDLVVGDVTTGALSIGAGGAVTTQGVGYIGREVGSTGTVTVAGADATWTLKTSNPLYGQYLKVGDGGTGYLYITDGGVAKVSFVSLGNSSGSHGVAEIRGSGSLMDSVELTVGASGKGELLIADGGHYDIPSLHTVYIGRNAEGDGTVTVDGSGSQMLNGNYGSSGIIVGGAGKGVLNMTNGARVGASQIRVGAEAGGYGEINMSGSGTLISNPGNDFFNIGEYGTGKLTISDGAVFKGKAAAYVGRYAGSTGNVSVSGTDSAWDLSQLHVGYSGYGEVTVSGGGRVTTSGMLSVGNRNGGEGTLLVKGTDTWVEAGELDVGINGTGKMIVSEGATVRVNGSSLLSTLKIGDRDSGSTGSGELTVTGDGTLLDVTGKINIADTSGNGVMTVADGALVRVSGDILVGNSPLSGSASIENAVLNIGDGTRAGTIEAAKISIHSLGTVNFNHAETIDFAPALTGTGTVNHIGTGTTRLMAGDNSQLWNDVNVMAGTLQAGAQYAFGNLLLGALGGYTVGEAGTLDLAGFDQAMGSLDNAGIVVLNTREQAGATLSILGTRFLGDGGYVGSGGTLRLNAVLGGDDSLADRMVVYGDTGGSTRVEVTNAGGGGATTVNGIQLIQVDGASNGEFALQGRVVAGAHEYLLYKGSKTDPDDGDWYLRSQAAGVDPGNPGISGSLLEPSEADLLRAEVAPYLNNQNAAVQMFQHTLNERLGDPGLGSRDEEGHRGAWVRVKRNQLDASVIGQQLGVDTDMDIVQMGGEMQYDVAQGRLHAGVMGGYGRAVTRSASSLTGYGARGEVKGANLGAYGTWYMSVAEPTGLYLDGWVQYSRYDNTIQGDLFAAEEYKSNVWSGSLEAGYALRLHESDGFGVYVEPQAQVIHTRYRSDSHTEATGSVIASQSAGSTTARLGARLYSRPLGNQHNRVQPFVAVNWWSGGNEAVVDMGDTRVRHRLSRNVYEAKAGAQMALGNGWSGWGSLGIQRGSDDYRDVNGQLGLKYNWQ